MKPRSGPYGRPGSKTRLSPWITWIGSHIIHRKWGELFAGTCAVTLNKKPVEWEFLNDADHWISNFLSVLRVRKQKAELLRRLRYSAWEQADFQRSCDIIRGIIPAPDDPVELARIFLVNNLQSYNRTGRTFSVSAVRSGTGKWKRIDEYIDWMAERIRDCTIFNLDYADALRHLQINDETTLIYADPPYVDFEKHFYRVNKKTGFDHVALRDHLEQCKASAIVSYEDHPLVRDLYLPENGWKIEKCDVSRYLGNNGKRARELAIYRKSEWARQQGGVMPTASGLQELYDLDGQPVT